MTESLTAEVAALDEEYEGWHSFVSDGLIIYSTHVLTGAELAAVSAYAARTIPGAPVADSVTLHSRTPELARHEIAKWQHRMAVAA